MHGVFHEHGPLGGRVEEGLRARARHQRQRIVDARLHRAERLARGPMQDAQHLGLGLPAARLRRQQGLLVARELRHPAQVVRTSGEPHFLAHARDLEIPARVLDVAPAHVLDRLGAQHIQVGRCGVGERVQHVGALALLLRGAQRLGDGVAGPGALGIDHLAELDSPALVVSSACVQRTRAIVVDARARRGSGQRRQQVAARDAHVVERAAQALAARGQRRVRVERRAHGARAA